VAEGADCRATTAEDDSAGWSPGEEDQRCAAEKQGHSALAACEEEAPKKRPARSRWEKPHIKFASKRATTWLRYWNEEWKVMI
jgi:hypothetical protein